jgi:hypothetical protein
MAPSALCCLLLTLQTAPQDPTTPPQAPATAPAAAEPSTADPTEVATLQRLELGKVLDVPACAALARSSNAAVAARATWLLGRANLDPTQPLLRELATSAPAADTRTQAMAALLRAGHRGSLDAALAGLDDSDVRVRTSAAQLLGRIPEPRSATGLLAFLARPGSPAAGAERNAPAGDAVAALLALHDLGWPEHLLPAASAVATSGQPHLGQALAYLFQDLTPKLPKAEEAKTLVAVLDHSEVLLRKYALSRLAVLGDPTTTAALERCLAGVGPALRPLAEAALAAARRHSADAAAATEPGPWQRLQARWQALPERSQFLAMGLLGTCAAALAATLFVGRRKRAAAVAADAGETMAELVQPSSEHLAELEAEAEAALAEAETLADGDGEAPAEGVLPAEAPADELAEELAADDSAAQFDADTDATVDFAAEADGNLAETEAATDEPALAWSSEPAADDELQEPPRR